MFGEQIDPLTGQPVQPQGMQELYERAALEHAATPLMERPVYAHEVYNPAALGAVYFGFGKPWWQA